MTRALGSDNIDHRLRHAQFAVPEGVRWLGRSIASLSQLQRVLVVGSHLRKDHPLFAQRIRQAVRLGAQLNVVNAEVQDWAMPVANALLAPAPQWPQVLANIAAAIASEKGIAAPVAGTPSVSDLAVARSLLSGENKAVLLGNAAAHHAGAGALLALAQWIAAEVGATVGYLTEAANTVGAQVVKAQPQAQGLNAAQMLSGSLKGVLLLNVEPEFDCAPSAAVASGLNKADMVVTLSAFKTNMAFSDVLLPVAPFTETSGTFVNAEARIQSFHAVVKPLGDTRPAWKVIRVLANLLGLPGFSDDSSQDVLARALAGVNDSGFVSASLLSNRTSAAIDVSAVGALPAVASIYQLDALVRRAGSLQLTVDARRAAAAPSVEEVTA